MKRVSTVIIIFLFLTSSIFSKEGLWLPLLVEQLNYDDLRAKGYQLTADDIYNINQACLCDAVVIFGSGCSGGVVSDEGLLFTNYHCGFGQVQRHSTVEKNYIQSGFWAKSKNEELPNPGLTVKFLVKTIDVTDLVVQSVNRSLPYNEQLPFIYKKIVSLEKTVEDTSEYSASIESFYKGENYYLFLYNEFKDIRLVGAPPESIGAFGGDTDNWVWPRHTADFSVFRIYMSPDGKPANYAEDNIPYKPRYSFEISARGVKQDDFTMVLGYPGSTDEYLYSTELELLNDVIYPNRIKLRTGRLDIIESVRSKSEEIYIQYAVKKSGIANAWKKWKGILYGFNKFNVIEKRKDYEKKLLEKAGSKKNQLQELFYTYDDIYLAYKPFITAIDYFRESVEAIDVFQLIQRWSESIGDIQSGNIEAVNKKLTAYGNSHFANQNHDLEKNLTAFLLRSYVKDMDESLIPQTLLKAMEEDKLDSNINSLYEFSIFTSQERYNRALEKLLKGKISVLKEDPFYILIKEFIDIYVSSLVEDYNYYSTQIRNLDKQYLELMKSIDTSRIYYPDANFTMRLSYGQVQGYSPSDAVDYYYQTYLSGMIDKAATGLNEYKLPERISDLYTNHDLGSYADENGRLPLCFIASNHTSGGSSGSPVLDGYGRLVGLNFDRTWESTMSDYNFDEHICRNIAVDMRYILFIIDKYSGAGYLLNEMNIVW